MKQVLNGPLFSSTIYHILVTNTCIAQWAKIVNSVQKNMGSFLQFLKKIQKP